MAEHDKFSVNEVPTPSETSSRTLPTKEEELTPYDLKYWSRTGDTSEPSQCKNIYQMVECLERNKNVGLDAKVITVNRKNEKVLQRMNRETFIKSFIANEKRFMEGSFSTGGFGGVNAGLIGDDFIPLLGGPFNKQLYLFDMLDQTQQAFWAYNHDPIAHRFIHIIMDFVLGKGFRVDFSNPLHDAIWEAFCKVNNIEDQAQYFCKELSMYGESMWWWLPGNETEIAINRGKDFQPRKGTIPRIRVMDPSQFWDFITQPEDVNAVLAYQWVTPTQYQIYTGITSGKNAGKSVPGSKFIYQQIPAEQIIHTKINAVSNEKRGRSDMFSAMGYLKRLRDSVNYSVIAMQKAAAWSMDTTIEGNSDDIKAYISNQQNLGTIAPAGSEFVHTSKVKREYLSNNATSQGSEPSAFLWCLNMACAAFGIPASYLGTHLSGGQTRASAVVATEPVAKLFENRQQVLESTFRKIIDGLMQRNGIDDYEARFTWPEVITQDRSAKLKDIYLAETSEWISPKRAGNMASKELGQDDYDWESEKENIDAERSMEPPTPLTAPPVAPQGPGKSSSGSQPTNPIKKPSAVTSDQKKNIKAQSTQ